MMVSSSARHALVDVENMPSTKRHQQWCLVVFGVCAENMPSTRRHHHQCLFMFGMCGEVTNTKTHLLQVVFVVNV